MSIFNLIFKSKIRYYNINSFIYCIILFIIIFYTDFAALSSYGINYSPLKKYTVKKRANKPQNTRKAISKISSS